MDIIGYSKNTHKNPKTSPNQGIHNQVPWLGLVSLFQIWDFSGYSLNTLKIYPKMEICYFFLWNKLHFFFDDNLVWSLVSQFLSCECSHFGGNYKKNKKVKNLAHIFYRKVKKISHTFIRRWKNFLTLPHYMFFHIQSLFAHACGHVGSHVVRNFWLWRTIACTGKRTAQL